MNELKKLNDVLNYVKTTFIGKDEIIDLLGIALVAKENAFLLGPPGTAKSAIIRTLSSCIQDGNNFEYLLTRFTEPNEIFGPFDIQKLKDGALITNTEGMLPEASIVFLDEIFNANSAILNSLLMALNERIFRRGKETKKIPALMFVGASNLLPEDESLNALLDRFLIRTKCDYVHPDRLKEVIMSGWNLENKSSSISPTISKNDIIQLQLENRKIDLSEILTQYIDVIHSLRNAGIKISDRRAVKLQNLIAASTLICQRTIANTSDLWVLKYIWDTEEQIEILEGIINNIIEHEATETSHPQALYNKAPNPEEIIKEVRTLNERWRSESLTLEEKNIVKDKLRYIQNRNGWVSNQDQKLFIQKEIDELWQQILKSI